MTDPTTISLAGLSKAAVLAALYNRARSMPHDWWNATMAPMTVAEAQRLMDRTPLHFFDYLQGRSLHLNLTKDTFDPWHFNRDNGEHAAEQAITALRQEVQP